MGGGMEANKNRYIEEWGSARENLEHNFRWTRRNFALVGIFGIALPFLVYKGIVRDFVTTPLSLYLPICCYISIWYCPNFSIVNTAVLSFILCEYDALIRMYGCHPAIEFLCVAVV